jgi:hypothetical protein
MQLWQIRRLQLWISRRMRREGNNKGLFISPHSSLQKPWRFAKTFPMTLLIVRSVPHVAISVGDGARDRLRCRRLSASACFLSRSRRAGGVHGNLGMVIATDQMALIANFPTSVSGIPYDVVDSPRRPDDARGLGHPRGGRRRRQPGLTRLRL